jgi:ATP-dependent Clp protease ATP-binding subunit ClpA
MARSIKLVEVSGDGRLEVTAAGIEFLNGIPEPIGVVVLVGPTHVGKSFTANILVQE